MKSSTTIAFKKVLENPEAAAEIIQFQFRDPSFSAKDLKACDLGLKLEEILDSKKFEQSELTPLCREIVEATAFWQDPKKIYAIMGVASHKDLPQQIPCLDYLYTYVAKEIQSYEIKNGQSDLKEPKPVEVLLINISGQAFPEFGFPD